jgi:cytochrome c-type biogenesis protein CcmH/NrfF
VSGTTGFIFAYAIGLIFLVGGILFLVVLSQNQLLFGIPYIVLGIVILTGLHMGRRRRKRQEHDDALLDAEEERARDAGGR